MFQSRLQPVLLIALPLLLLMAFSLWVFAPEQQASQIGNVMLPEIMFPANATSCVAPVDIMRRYHMNFLMDQRDATVIDGIRTEKFSLTGCIDCHNARPATEEAVLSEDPKNFCADCHGFTAVKIDCFECHSARASEP